jgi:hypothetical protein
VLVASMALAGAATPAAGQTGGVALACADGTGGGPVAETDTGLEVADNASRSASRPSFPASDTVAFDDAAFSAAGDASLRLEAASPSTVCAAELNTGARRVAVSPDNATTVVVEGELSRFAYTGPSLAGDGATDLAYRSDSPVAVQLDFDDPPGDGLNFVDSGGDQVAATDAESPEQVVTLPAGEYAINIQRQGTSGGSSGQEGSSEGEGEGSGDDGGSADSGEDVSIEEGENIAGGGGGGATTATETSSGEAIRAPGGGGGGGLVTPPSTPTPSSVGQGGVALFGGVGGGGGGAPLVALLGLLVVVLVGIALFVRRRGE